MKSTKTKMFSKKIRKALPRPVGHRHYNVGGLRSITVTMSTTNVLAIHRARHRSTNAPIKGNAIPIRMLKNNAGKVCPLYCFGIHNEANHMVNKKG